MNSTMMQKKGEFERFKCKYSQIGNDEDALIREKYTCVFLVNSSLNDLIIYPSTLAIHYEHMKTSKHLH